MTANLHLNDEDGDHDVNNNSETVTITEGAPTARAPPGARGQETFCKGQPRSDGEGVIVIAQMSGLRCRGIIPLCRETLLGSRGCAHACLASDPESICSDPRG